MKKKSMIFALGLVYSLVAFADFSGQTVQVDWLLDTTVQAGTIGIDVPGSGVFDFGGDPAQTCNIDISAAQITIGNCNFPFFGNTGGITFNGLRFTQAATAPDITGVTPTGAFEAVTSNADSINANLILKDLQATSALVLDVTFAAPVVNTSAVPVLAPLGLWLFGLLIAGVSYRVHRRR